MLEKKKLLYEKEILKKIKAIEQNEEYNEKILTKKKIKTTRRTT